MLQAMRPSSTRQYESCWKAFHRFLRDQEDLSVSEGMVFSFLSFMVHEQNRQLPTVAVHLAALSDPLWYGYGIRMDPRAVTLLKRGLFHQRPPLREKRATWSLQKILDLLQSQTFGYASTPLHTLQKALFLTALATGFRAYQLRTLTRFPQWTSFAEDLSNVSLAPSPRFLAKNERENHHLQPVVVPAWVEQGVHHSLCLVTALKTYLDSSLEQPLHSLFTSQEGKQLSTRGISALLRKLIEEADPGKAIRAHDIRGAASSLAFLRTYSVSRVTEGGQWSSSRSFVTRYLSHTWYIPCIALGMLPTDQHDQSHVSC